MVARTLNAAQGATKDFPNEMFSNIFWFLCPPGAASMGSRNSRPSAGKEHPTADLRRVTQVCSVWRTAALASPSLWSTSLNFNDEALPWLKELLRRCGSMPIHITADFSSVYAFHSCGGALKAQGMIEKFELMLTSSLNIGSISVVYNKNSPFVPIIENFLSRKCSSATRLSFSTLAWRIPRGRQIDGELLPSLNNHHLRQLEVNGYRPDLTLTCFRQLAWLSVSSITGETASDWVRVLAGLPELEHLRLEDAISSNTEFQVGFQAKSIQFICLKTLTIIGDFDDGIGDFLLAIEATKKYSLFLHCTIGKHTNLSHLLYGLQKWFAIWNINLQTDVGQRRVDFMASHTRFRLHNQIPGKELSDEWFRIFFSWRRLLNPHSLRKLQADVFQILGPVLRQTRTLSICPDTYDHGYICGPDFWQEYFHEVKTLRFLNSTRDGDINDSTTGCFINAICNDIGVSLFVITFPNLIVARVFPERSTSSTFPLPLLRVLSFERENFMYNPPIGCMQSLERLSMVLGHQIDVVELYACKGTSDVRSLLTYWATRVLVSEMKSPRF